MSSKKVISKQKPFLFNLKFPLFSLNSNSRGFNMFSAIVAMILIMTSVVLTSTLVTTEEKTSRQIYSMLNNYQLADAANLARADALQSFNYNFRDKLEDYLTYNGNELERERGFPLFTIKSSDDKFEWEEIEQNFEDMILLTKKSEGAVTEKDFAAAISYVADRTIEQFNEQTYGKFSVYLSDRQQSAKNILRENIISSMKREQAKGKSFLEVVGCNDTYCPVGTFYFNIPLNNLTDAEYEALPRIIVKDQLTQEEIKMAILPRTQLRIYFPLRFFKALFEARKSALSAASVGTNLEAYRLGFCKDDGGCLIRSDPRIKAVDFWPKECPTAAIDRAELVRISGTAPAGVETYAAGGPNTGAEGLVAFGSYSVCEKAMNDGVFDTRSDTFFVKDQFLAMQDTLRKKDINACQFNKMEINTKSREEYKFSSLGSGFLYCAKIRSFNFDIAFEETDPTYIVKGTYETGKKNVYKIRIDNQSLSDMSVLDKTTLPVCTSGISGCKA